MVITRVRAENFKNLDNVDITLNDKVNVLYGKNAQGKTNFIEAMWMCSGLRSFRNTKDKDFIGIDKDYMKLSLDFKDSVREQNISIEMKRSSPKDKLVTLNGVKQKSLSAVFGNLNCVVFTPEDLELSKGSPDNRRNFIDIAIAQIKNAYSKVVARYETVLANRNAMLKSITYGTVEKIMLEIYDAELSKLGSYISMLRYNYVKKLFKTASELYREISGSKEELNFFYQSTVFDNLEGKIDYKKSMANDYFFALRKNEENDLHCGFTQLGVHRDDLLVSINGLSTREFASQGQHRSVALVLKLAQAYILCQENKESPVIFLDDVLSELDYERQEFVLNKIKNMQLFITCCDSFPEMNEGQQLTIENGRISKA